MKIFTAAQIREWDAFTILNEPVSATVLMERAAKTCHDWIIKQFPVGYSFTIFCGNGNNGGDGLALARMLHQSKINVTVYLLSTEKRSEKLLINFERLQQSGIKIHEIATIESIPSIPASHIIIDALYGTGLNKPIQGIAEKIVATINQSTATIISIDLPSGLYSDQTSKGNSIVKASFTLSFQIEKLCFMFAENEMYLGKIFMLDIGLSEAYYNQTSSLFSTTDIALIQQIYQPRKQFTHKYNFGHVLLIAGSNNMAGAAILTAKACYRSGAGLVTVYNDAITNSNIQIAVPETITSNEKDITKLIYKKSAIAIGPGLALNDENELLLKNILITSKVPVVIDASALKLLQKNLRLLPADQPAILTPHTGEFEKLFGETMNDFERAALAIQKAAQHTCYIVLKGRNTMLACPSGEAYFNTTGNSGMATAGSGDVLTGIICGLLAQGYVQKEACLMGVYLHGLAGDIAAEKFGMESMIASDITENLGAAYKSISK